MLRHKKPACSPWSHFACNTPSYRAVWVFLCFLAVSKTAPQLTVCLHVAAGALWQALCGWRNQSHRDVWERGGIPPLTALSPQDGPAKSFSCLFGPLELHLIVQIIRLKWMELVSGLAGEEWSQDHGKLILD